MEEESAEAEEDVNVKEMGEEAADKDEGEGRRRRRKKDDGEDNGERLIDVDVEGI